MNGDFNKEEQKLNDKIKLAKTKVKNNFNNIINSRQDIILEFLN